MAGRAPCPTSVEANCVKIFKKNQVKRLSRLLLSKNRVSIASLSLKSQLRQSNCYLQTTVIGQCKKSKHPRRGPQIPLRVKDQGDDIQVIDVILQGPGVSSYPENTVGSSLYILDCNLVPNPWIADVRTTHQYCLIVKMPLKTDEEQLYLVNDAAAESQQKRAGVKRFAGSSSEEENEEEEEEEEGESREAPLGKQCKKAKVVRATEGGVVLTAEVAQSHRASANDEGAGPSATGPRPCAAQQEDSAEVRASTHRVLLQGDSSSHQTKRTIACQASPLAAKSKEYHYTKLKDLSNSFLKINVFGVVKTYNQPTKSRGGTDFFSSLRLVDETGEAQCTLFSQELERLPKIEKIGDIVRLHRVGVSSYQGNFQIIGRKIFSCLAIDGCPGQPVVPWTNATEFTFTNEDQKRVEELRAWAATQPSLNPKERRCILEKVIPGLYFDLVCQVISTCLIAANDCGIVRVWDGTKVAVNTRAVDRYGHPSNSDSNLEELIQDLSVDITLYNNHMDAVRSLIPGQFIRLNNVHAACYLVGRDGSEVVDLCIHRGRQFSSGVTELPAGHPDVEALKPKLSVIIEQRMRLFRRDEVLQPRVQQTSVTVCPGHTEQLDTIQDVLSCQKVPYKHRLRVKFVRLVEQSLEDCVKLVCTHCWKSDFPIRQSFADAENSQDENSHGEDDTCPNCAERGETESQLKFLYRMKFEVADHTGKMTVLLGDKYADTFFPGLPPSNLHLNLATHNQLLQRLKQLSAGEDIFVRPREAGRGRPFMECCILSYYVGGTEMGRASGKVAYQIYDTILEAGSEQQL